LTQLSLLVGAEPGHCHYEQSAGRKYVHNGGGTVVSRPCSLLLAGYSSVAIKKKARFLGFEAGMRQRKRGRRMACSESRAGCSEQLIAPPFATPPTPIPRSSKPESWAQSIGLIL